jgi:hypothetical protein
VNENAEYDRRKCGIAFGMNENRRSPEIRNQKSEIREEFPRSISKRKAGME